MKKGSKMEGEVLRIYEFRLRPNRHQENQLQDTLDLTRALYNTGLEELITHYKTTGKKLNKYAHDKMHNTTTDPQIYSHLVDTTIAKLHKSFENFFRGIKTNRKVGFPRFKSYSRWRTLEFRDANINRLTGRYFYSGEKVAGRIRVVVHREVEGAFRHARIIKKPSGWYLQLVYKQQKMFLSKTGTAIGLDVGIKYLVADSSGNFIENDKVLKGSIKKFRVLQRSLFRKVKGSVRRRKAASKLARQHERIANRRKDHLHKVSTKLVRENDLIAIEDLKIENMKKNRRLAFSINDASWGILKRMLFYKAENAGRVLICVKPDYTSQMCSMCGQIVKKSLSERTHCCNRCGYIVDRDTNAAQNILRLGLGLQEPTYASM